MIHLRSACAVRYCMRMNTHTATRDHSARPDLGNAYSAFRHGYETTLREIANAERPNATRNHLWATYANADESNPEVHGILTAIRHG